MSTPNTWAKATVKNDWGSPITNVEMHHRYDNDHHDDKSWASISPGKSGEPFDVGYWTGFGRSGYDYWLIKFEADGRAWTCKSNFYCFLRSDDTNGVVQCRVFKDDGGGKMEVVCPKSSNATVRLFSKPIATSAASRPRPNKPTNGICYGTLTPGCEERAPGPQVTFEEALKLGASEVGVAGGMGFCDRITGSEVGSDEDDRYDAKVWTEPPGSRGHLIPKAGISPWAAFKNLVEGVKKQRDLADEAKTWAVDCAGFVVINRIYAHYRTMTNLEFNKKFTSPELGTLDIGTQSSIWKEFQSSSFKSEGPDAEPLIYVIDPDQHFEYSVYALNTKKTMHQLLDEVPVGSHVAWCNLDALKRCAKDDFNFCYYQYENTTKVGPNQYSAHPMGIRSSEEIEDQLAHIVIDELIAKKKLAKATVDNDSNYIAKYIKKNIHIKTIMVPKGSDIFDRYKGPVK